MRFTVAAIIVLLCISAASAVNVTSFMAVPPIININNTVNVSAEVFSQTQLSTAGFTVRYPNISTEFVAAQIFSNFVTVSMPEPTPYNITVSAKTYNFTVNCSDFTDKSKCDVYQYSINASCLNVTFDDDPETRRGDQDLDIGIIGCITENSSGYFVNFTRWGYDAGNDVRANFCLDSSYGVNYCSGWILNNSGCGSTPNCYVPQTVITVLNKAVFGGYYLNFFSRTNQYGTYNLNFFANDTNGHVNDTERTSFSIGESNPPVFLSQNINPASCNAMDKVLISAQVFDESKINYVHALISGAEQRTLPLSEGPEGRYSVSYYPPDEGIYYVQLYATDIFGNINSTFAGSITAYKPILPPSRETCKNISSIGLMSERYTLSKEKVLALMRTSYYCAKNILGLWGYDFQVTIRYINGTVVEIDGIPIIYGKTPDITKSIYVSRQIVLLPPELGKKSAIIYLSIWRT